MYGSTITHQEGESPAERTKRSGNAQGADTGRDLRTMDCGRACAVYMHRARNESAKGHGAHIARA